MKDIEDEAIIDEFGGDVNDVVNLESDKNSAPVLKKLSIRYGSSLGIIFGFVLIMFIICVVFIYKTAHIAPAIVHAGKRQASVSKMDLLHLELVLFDEATWTSREEIRVCLFGKIILQTTGTNKGINGRSTRESLCIIIWQFIAGS